MTMRNALPVRILSGDTAIKDILSLIQRSYAYMAHRIDPPSSMHRLSIEDIDKQCAANEVWSIGEPPRACVFLSERADCLYVGKLAVDESFRGQGYARALIDLAEARARSKGVSALLLETRVELQENHDTFRRLGFVKCGEGAHEGYDRPTYLIMRKDI